MKVDSARAAALYRQGAEAPAIAAEMGVSLASVYNALKREKVVYRPRARPYPALVAKRFEMEWRAGDSMHVIARRHGTSHKKIAAALRARGCEIRKGALPRERHHMWRGGRRMHEGYVQLKLPEGSPFASMAGRTSYVMEHRLVMAEYLGRPLAPWETVHHVNGDKLDNRIENLQLRVGSHGSGAAFACARCGSHDLVPVRL